MTHASPMTHTPGLNVTKKKVEAWWRRWLCPFGFHDFARHQEIFVTDTYGDGQKAEVIIAWDQCHICSKTKLIHILK